MELYIEETSATRSCAIKFSLVESQAKNDVRQVQTSVVCASLQGVVVGPGPPVDAIAGAFAIIILLIGAAVSCRMHVLMQQL